MGKGCHVDSNFRALCWRESGLKAALALPILSGDQVIAVIEFFMREPQDEDERLVKVITAVAAQLDLAIERKRAEEQVRRTQAELAHVSRVTTMGELAASIAHEVNQPLGAIVGNADICLQWLRDTEPDLEQLREAIEDIASDGRRASEVIARIRSLVKKNPPERAQLDVSELAREVLDLVAHEAHRKQITIRCDLEVGLPMVKGDRVQLQQVLLNLVMNGLEAMTNLKSHDRSCWCGQQVSQRRVLTAVRDCGPGVKPEDAEQLFKPFHTTKSAGMGMGLAISRSLVEAHGGRLWFEPTPEPGAQFKFTLPASSQGGS
jgi:C4-dicarboxylate-specific signal transduction histidine kinase